MSVRAPAGDIPSPEAFARKKLLRAPEWLQHLVSNTLALCAWVGLPSTVISAIADLSWVLRSAEWAYAHAGMARPVLLAAGEGLHAAIEQWRQVTHPVWQTIASWLHITLPVWAPDVLTLFALLGVGLLRRVLRVAWGETISGGMMYRGAKPSFGRPEDKVAIPRSFPYRQHFAECGVRWTPAKTRDVQRLWRKWRRFQIRAMLAYDGRYWPKFDQDVIRAQFGRYWLSVTDGRRDMLMYAGAGSLILFALATDWLWQWQAG